jgi:hypothetical protein
LVLQRALGLWGAQDDDDDDDDDGAGGGRGAVEVKPLRQNPVPRNTNATLRCWSRRQLGWCLVGELV